MTQTLDLRSLKGPHVFVNSLENPVLSDADRSHLSKSLRLKAGDAMTVCDGQGSWRQAHFGDVIETTGPIRTTVYKDHTTADAANTGGFAGTSTTCGAKAKGVAVALAKGTKPELVTQKATELGIDEIIFFRAQRSVVRWDDTKVDKALKRLERIGREACMQSKRLTLSHISYAHNLAEVLAYLQGGQTSGASENRPAIARADFGGTATFGELDWVIIGPEGGWDEQEVALLGNSVDLGATVLRCETAAITAAALLTRHNK